MVDAAFAHRRKVLRGALRDLAGSGEAADGGADRGRGRPDGARRVARPSSEFARIAEALA